MSMVWLPARKAPLWQMTSPPYAARGRRTILLKGAWRPRQKIRYIDSEGRDRDAERERGKKWVGIIVGSAQEEIER